MKVLNVALGERSYPIYIGNDLLKNKLIIQKHVHGKQVVIVSNDVVAPLYLKHVVELFNDYDVSTVVLADGEAAKTLLGIMPIIDLMMQKQIDRKVTLVALGGGVIGDMTGFAASVYRRGVNFIQIPTTLLAQVDSSVGGKTGVNHELGKNMIGPFYQPQCVLADINTLSTLEKVQLSSGLAEVIKYALLNGGDFFSWLEDNMQKLLQLDVTSLSYVIEKSCQDKADVVAADEKESGVRALLNLGHTFGHAIGTALGYGKILHGEAISIGMMMAANLSHRHAWIELSSLERLQNLFMAAKLPIDFSNYPSAEKKINRKIMLELMQGDKKVLDGTLHLVLFKSEAMSFICADYDLDKLKQTIDDFL